MKRIITKRTRSIFLLSATLLLFLSSFSSATIEYAVKESRNCPYCHAKDGPPQLNDVGIYYGTHNHSFLGHVPTPIGTPTPEPTKEIEIGVHMNTWDVGLRAFAAVAIILLIVLVSRL